MKAEVRWHLPPATTPLALCSTLQSETESTSHPQGGCISVQETGKSGVSWQRHDWSQAQVPRAQRQVAGGVCAAVLLGSSSFLLVDITFCKADIIQMVRCEGQIPVKLSAVCGNFTASSLLNQHVHVICQACVLRHRSGG